MEPLLAPRSQAQSCVGSDCAPTGRPRSSCGCNVNMYAHMIEDNGWLDKIENLQNHDNSRIVEMAACMLDTYWSKEDIAMNMPWDDPLLGLAEDHPRNFDFFARPGDCDFG